MNRIVRFAIMLWLASSFCLAGETGVAARVNGTEISYFRLERHFADYLKAQGREVGAIRSPVAYKRLKREALQQLIDKELLWQEAQRRGRDVDVAQVSAQLEALQAAFASPEAFSRALDEAGFDKDSYREYLHHELVADHMLAELAEVPPPTEAEVRQAYAGIRERLDPSIDEAGGLAMVREYLLEQRQAEGRSAALARLREAGRVEVLVRL
jgi:peptidyl-prolyl cis-trans isomerase C